MNWENEGKSHNGKPKNSGLLPTGDKAKEIVELLAEMCRAMHNPEDTTDVNDRSERANHSRDAGPEKEGGEQTR